MGTRDGVDGRPVGKVKLLLTEPEAADALGISPRALWDLRSRGEIPVVRVGRSVRYSIRDLEAWIDRNRSTGGSAAEPDHGELHGEPE